MTVPDANRQVASVEPMESAGGFVPPAGPAAQVPAGSAGSIAAKPSSRLTVSTRALDFLRGAAAFYVLIGHARGHLFAGGARLMAEGNLHWFDYLILALLQLTSMGTEAVIVFFVLSGFAMAHSFSHSETTWSFYKKRAIRIWPPYLAALALAFVFAAIILRSPQDNGVTRLVGQVGWGITEAIQRAFYTNVDTELTGQYWSLPLEVVFYIACPLLLVSKSRVTLFFFASIAMTITVSVVTGIYADPTIGGGLVYRFFLSFLIFFMSGAIAYHFPHLIPRVSGKLLTLIFAVSFVAIWYFKYHVFDRWNLISSLMTIPLAVLLIFNIPSSLYNLKWANWGHFSYSLYIVHVQLLVMTSYILWRIWGIEQPQMTSYWMWVLIVPPTVAFSWVFYTLTEKRCNAALARVRRREREAIASTATDAGAIR